MDEAAFQPPPNGNGDEMLSLGNPLVDPARDSAFLDLKPRTCPILEHSSGAPHACAGGGSLCPNTVEKHSQDVLRAMKAFRGRRELCDIVVHAGSKTLYAHKIVIAACSPYFYAMFTNEMAESHQSEVTIRDVDEKALEAMIDYCYTSQIVVEEDNVQTLLPAACLLQIQAIQDICCDFLKNQLDPSNCLGIRAFADTHACRDLLRIADKFTQKNFQEVCSFFLLW